MLELGSVVSALQVLPRILTVLAANHNLERLVLEYCGIGSESVRPLVHFLSNLSHRRDTFPDCFRQVQLQSCEGLPMMRPPFPYFCGSTQHPSNFTKKRTHALVKQPDIFGPNQPGILKNRAKKKICRTVHPSGHFMKICGPQVCSRQRLAFLWLCGNPLGDDAVQQLLPEVHGKVVSLNLSGTGHGGFQGIVGVPGDRFLERIRPEG